MNPHTGELFTPRQVRAMSAAERAELVMLQGKAEDIERISAAVSAMNRAERRRANRAAGRLPSGDPKP